MASSALPGVLAWVGGEVAKVAIRASYGPRMSGPMERLVDRGVKAIGQRYGVSADGNTVSGMRFSGPVPADIDQKFWTEMVPARQWSIELITGSQGTGKSCLAARLCEIYQRNGRSSLWLAKHPDEVQAGLDRLLNCQATAISKRDLMARMKARDLRQTVIVIDDAVLAFDAYSSQADDSKDFHEFLAVDVRKGENHVVLATQETGLLDKHGMQPSVVWAKPPLANYEDFERGGMRKISRRAVTAYQQVPQGEWAKRVYVEEFGAIGSFAGLVTVALAAGWSDTLSRAR